MGKSVFASKFCTLANERKLLAACFFFQHHQARRNNPNVLVKTLVYQLCSNISCYKEKIKGILDKKSMLLMKAVDLFTYLILEPLHELPGTQDQKKIIVIDGLDECDFESQNELLKLVTSEFVKLPEWFGVIITTRPDQKILRKLSKIKPVFHLDPEDPRNIGDIKIYLTDVLKAKMLPEQLDSGVQLMTKKSEGMFLYFHYAVEAILDKEMLTLKDLDALLPDGVDNYYGQNFQRLHTKLGKKKYQLLFQAITAARSDFPQELVCPLLKVEKSEALQIIDTVSVLLPVRNGCLTIFHKSIKDWLIDEELAEDLAVNPIAGHSQVALICYAEFKTVKTNAIPIDELISKPIYKYAIENVVYHLSKTSGKPDDIMKLCHTVTDLQYMYYRLYTSQMSAKDLLDDLMEAKKLVQVKSESFRKLELSANFLHRHAHIVGACPHLIFQCALNEPQLISMQLGIQNYMDNPGTKFPGLHMYLELINKPQNYTPALTEYHCTNNVVSFDYSLDGKIIACRDGGGKVYVWNKNTGELLCDLDRKEWSSISKCSISPNGKEILVGDIAEVIGTDGSIIPLFEGENSSVNACVFSPNGEYILGWSYYTDGFFRLLAEIQMGYPEQFCVQVWNRNAATSKLLERTGRKEVRPFCGCFSHDSSSVLCGHRDGWIIIWETESIKPKAMLSTDGTVIKSGPFKRSQDLKDDPIYDIACSPNGHFIAVCYSDGILIWDAAALGLVQKIQPSTELPSAQTNIRYTGCTFSGDSQHLTAGLLNGYINAWMYQTTTVEPFSLQLSTNLCGSSDAIHQCMFDDEKNLICSINNVIGVYDYQALLNNPTSKTVAIHPYYATSCEFLSGGQVALTNGNGTICTWDVIQGALIAKTGISVAGHLIKLSYDKKLLLTYGSSCTIQVWDIETLSIKCTLTSNEGNDPTAEELADPDFSSSQDICSCAVSANGIVAGGTGEGKILIWYGEKFQLFKILKGHQHLITCLEFSPNSSCLVSADMEGFINMWLLTFDGKEDLELHEVNMQHHRDSIEQVLFSPGQLQRIVSGSTDCMLHLYDGLTGDLIKKMEGHKSDIMKIAYSKCGRFLASGDGKCQLILWDGITGQLLRYFNSSPSHVLLELYFTGNDEYICTLDANRDQFTVYNISKAMPVSVLGFSSQISAFAASSLQDDITGYILCGMKDGSIKFLKLMKLA